MYRIVLCLLSGIVQGFIRHDVGDIPYEDRGNAVDQHFGPLAITEHWAPVRDYGNIPYEEKKAVSKHHEYGDIPYEKAFATVRGEDYGNIPYEKDLGSTNAEGIDSIRGKIKDILGGRDIPQQMKTGSPLGHRASSPAGSTLSKIMTSLNELPSIEMRAKTTRDDSATDDYVSPPTIDDWYCDRRRYNCTTCTDTEGYRVYCLNKTYSTTPAPSDIKLLIDILVDLTKDYEDYNSPKILNRAAYQNTIKKNYPANWAYCASTPKPTTTTTVTPYPPHDDDGKTIQKCFVCGMSALGIPSDHALCSDSFLSHSFKKHCKYIDGDDWFFNGTADFYMWGGWTGGCSMRFVDITPVYTQRTCRNRRVPTLGGSYVSRRLAKLEFSLMGFNDSCITTPHASLVPLTRGISLYSKMTVCVCSKDYCNGAERSEAAPLPYTMIAVVIMKLGYF